MKINFIYLFVTITFLLHNPFESGAQQFPDRLSRSESYFGIHFDLHAESSDNELGKTLTEAMIDSFLQRVQPDFIQIDSKGHSGISSYPTDVGYRAGGYVIDPLKLWRKVTKKNGVALYVHFSGIYDRKVAQEYPEWAITNADGTPDDEILSTYSPYPENFLIPQLKELITKYDIDGAWIDGECWAIKPDYRQEALREFKNQTGIKEVPRSPEDPNYGKFMAFNRQLFKNYVRDYVYSIHEFDAGFELTSNWAFSSMMPEKVRINLDFLSGDVVPGNSVNRAAFEARTMASQGIHWDLMPWSFSWSTDKSVPRNTKSPIQMKQEISQIIAVGGAVMPYFRHNRDLSIEPWTIDIMEELSVFTRKRQQFCENGEIIPQIALLYPNSNYLNKVNDIYPEWNEELNSVFGALVSLLDGHNAVEVLMEHHLLQNTNKYPLIVIPETSFLPEELQAELINYVRQGGNLLLLGSHSPQLFKKELGITDMHVTDKNNYKFSINKTIGAIHTNRLNVKLDEGEIIEKFYTTNDFRFPSAYPVSSLHKFGDGNIGVIYFDVGKAYMEYKTNAIRELTDKMVDTLFQFPFCRVLGKENVHVTVTRKNDSHFVHLVNILGDHEASHILGYKDIPVTDDLIIEILTNKKPKNMILQPMGKQIEFDFSNGTILFDVPGVEIYNIIEIVYPN